MTVAADNEPQIGADEGGTKSVVKRVAKEKEEPLTKIVLRRLPPGIGPDELNALFAPLPPGEPHAFWFCAATPIVSAAAAGDDHQSDTGIGDVTVMDEVAAALKRARCAFARAYLVFREEQNALAFAERFNGYVFVDKNGIESMAIVELAPNQTVPKHSIEIAKQCDERVNTLTNDAAFLKFVRRREAALAADTVDHRRVTDFDELVRQLEDKQRRLEEGQVQETPLTEFIRRMALEKAARKSRGHRLGLAAPVSEITPASDQCAKEQQHKIGKTRADKKMAESKDGKASSVQKKTRRERRRRKEQKAKEGDERKKLTDDDEGKKKSAEAKNVIIKTHKTRRLGGTTTSTAAASPTAVGDGSGGGVAGPSVPSSSSACQSKIGTKSAVGGDEGGGGPTSATPTDKKMSMRAAATSASTTKSGGGEVTAAPKMSKRNKDRPEREIYRPGQRKAKQQETDADQTKK